MTSLFPEYLCLVYTRWEGSDEVHKNRVRVSYTQSEKTPTIQTEKPQVEWIEKHVHRRKKKKNRDAAARFSCVSHNEPCRAASKNLLELVERATAYQGASAMVHMNKVPITLPEVLNVPTGVLVDARQNLLFDERRHESRIFF